MKSKLMQQGVTPSFYEDVKTLASIPEPAFRDFVSEYERLTVENGQPDNEKMLPIAARHNVTIDELARAFRIAEFLFEQERDENDPVAAATADLVAAQKLSPSEAATVIKRVKDSAGTFGGVLAEAGKRSADIGMTFPTLEHLHTRCSTAVRFKQEFDATRGDPQEYDATIEHISPVVVVQMDIDKYGETERFVVGLSARELDDTIAHLQFAREQINHLKERLNHN